MVKKLVLFLIVAIASTRGYAQQRFNPDTIMTVVIDSTVNIKSHKLTAQDFIDAVLADTGFYKAFRNMKRYAFVADNHIYTYDKKNKVDGEIYRRIKHTVVNGKPKNEYLIKQDKGNIYKKKWQIPVVHRRDV